ncbi:MAG TPA: DUF3037 domain-containing protein [Ktedonobacterales bacterium]
MPARSSFDYAIIRVMPEVERGECVNVGVVLICRPRRYLGMRLAIDDARLLALWPPLDIVAVRSQLDGILRVAEGDAAAGPIARLSQAERFHWLVAPSSTIIQPSPVHSGLCAEPAAALDALMERLVALPAPEQPANPTEE